MERTFASLAGKAKLLTTAASASLQSSHSEGFADGIEVLYDSPSADIDICFVHGLTGNRRTTWTARGDTAPWPQRLLPAKFTTARILTYGYDAYIVRGAVASRNGLSDHARNLLNDLTSARDKNPSRPIIFVAHSLGGLVCKESILLSRFSPEPHLRPLFESTKAIAFMGTPHEGSWMVDWAKTPAKALGIIKSSNCSLLEVLQTNNKLLESLQDRFSDMIRYLREDGRKLEITCFYEELPLFGIGTVVSKRSATFSGYNLKSIHANHRDMVRFETGEDTGFQRLVSELERWARDVKGVPSNLPTIIEALSIFGLPDNSRSRGAVLTTSIKLGLDQILDDLAHCGHSESERGRYAALKNQIRVRYDDAVKRCLLSLSFSEMSIRASGVKSPFHGSCDWIYQHNSYLQWCSNPCQLLCIKGKPGSGKTILLKSLYISRKRSTKDCRTIFLQFFFNARGSAEENTLLGLYKSLTHQILEQDRLLMCEFLPTFCQKLHGRDDATVDWQVAELAEAIHQIIEQEPTNELEIFIDALDECNETQVREAVRRFEVSLGLARSMGLQRKICWTSRYYPIVSLRSEVAAEISVDEHNFEDILRFVEEELPLQLDSSLALIRQSLLANANGVFLWVDLVTKKILRAIDRGKPLEGLLYSIPVELDDLYYEIFQELEELREVGEDLIQISQWILCSFRPLSLAEINTALGIQHESYIWQAERSSEEVAKRMKRRIVDVSGGLFEVVPLPDNDDIWQAKVQVIHESVREFFFFGKGLRLLGSSSRSDIFSMADKKIVLTGFHALSLAAARTLDIPGRTQYAAPLEGMLTFLLSSQPQLEIPFLRNYIASYLFQHLDHLRASSGQEFSVSAILQLPLKVRQNALIAFLRLYNPATQLGPATLPGLFSEYPLNSQVFGFAEEDLLRLADIINQTFLARRIYGKNMLPKSSMPPSRHPNDFVAEYIAAFCVSAGPERGSKLFHEFTFVKEASNAGQIIRDHMYFVFSACFNVLASNDILNRKLSYRPRANTVGSIPSSSMARNDDTLPIKDYRIVDSRNQADWPESFARLARTWRTREFHQCLRGGTTFYVIVFHCPQITGGLPGQLQFVGRRGPYTPDPDQFWEPVSESRESRRRQEREFD